MDADSDFDDRSHALARLAALERLREQLKRGERKNMLRSIERMIDHEARTLRKQREPKPQS